MQAVLNRTRREKLAHFLAQLQDCWPGLHLALRLPGSPSPIVFSHQPWALEGLEEAVQQRRQLIGTSPQGELSVLHLNYWGSDPLSGCLLALQHPGRLQVTSETLEALSRSARMFWENLAEPPRAAPPPLDVGGWRSDFLEALLQHSTEMILLISVDGRVFYHTPSVSRLAQDRDQDQAQGCSAFLPELNYFEWVHPDDRPQIREALLRVYAHKQAVGPLHCHMFTPQGLIQVESHFTLLNNRAGGEFVVVHCQDVSARKREAKFLISRELRFRQRLEQQGLVLIEFDAQQRLTFASLGWEKLAGRSVPQSLGLPLEAFFALPAGCQPPFSGQLAWTSKLALTSPGEAWAEIRLFCNQAPEESGGWGLIRSASCQSQQGKLQQSLEQVQELVLWLDSEGRVTALNRAAREATEAEIRLPNQLIFEQLRSLAGLSGPELLAQARDQGSWQGLLSWKGLCLEGHLVALEAREGFVLSCRDITSEQQLQEQLQKQQKLQAMALQASGLAHDFNNLLQVIIGNASLDQNLREQEGLPASSALNDVLMAAEQGRAMICQLKSLDSHGRVELRPLNLVEHLPPALHLLSRTLAPSISCHWNCQLDKAMVRANLGQLQQLVLNLATNAREAMPEGGRFSLSLTARERGFRLLFQDSGLGLEPEECQRIFSTFYSSKSEAGSGLGLAVVASIVETHGGTISVESEPGLGTTLVVDLPAFSQENEAC